jgi:tRNA(Glu) U13 pseudouridine synthase TruD
MKLFWKRKIQKNARGSTTLNPSPSVDTMTTGKKRNREDGDETEGENSSSSSALTTNATTSTRWFLWYTLVKVNLEQIDCCRRLSELLGISINHVNQAGIKDRRGYTIQKGCLLIDTNDSKLLKSLDLFRNQTNENSFRNPEFNVSAMRTLSFVQDKLMAMNTSKFKLFLESGTFDRGYVLPQTACPCSSSSSSSSSSDSCPALIEIGMALGDFEFKEIGISPGDLKGNRFNILLRDVTIQEMNQDGSRSARNSGLCAEINVLESIKQRLLTLEQFGFPNFFGTQRMGIVSAMNAGDSATPIGPIIGKYLLQNNATGAVYCILSGLEGGREILFPTRLNDHSDETRRNRSRRQ